MDLYPSPFQKSKMSLIRLARLIALIAFFIFWIASFAIISSMILIPIGMARLLKKLDRFSII